MRSALTLLVILLATILPHGDRPEAATPAGSPSAELHQLFDAYWELVMRESPTWATYLGDHRYNDRLGDMSEAGAEAYTDSLRGYLGAIQRFERAGLDDTDRMSAMLFERNLNQRIEGAAFRPHLVPVSQQNGPHISFPQLVEYQPFETVADWENYIDRLDAFSVQIDQVIACMRAGIEAGIVPYRTNIEAVIPQLASHIVDDPTEQVLYSPASKLAETTAIPAAERERLRAALTAAISESIVPAYKRLASFTETEYLPACRNEPGIWALPDGAERYAYQIHRYTTTSLTAEEIHAIGRREMKRIREEMETIRAQVGFEGDLDDFMTHLRTDPKFYCKTSDELMQGFRDILAVMDRKLPQLFGRLPEAPYDLKEIESYRAAAAPAAYYYSPPDDGSRPGYFYVNTYNLPTRPKYTMEALAYHEAVPGHHLQIAVQQELGELPTFRRHQGFTAFVEGWGLYSESLPKEVGLYADPYSDFGRLTFEAWRASRLVVDTGMHAMKWSREQAIEYLKSNTALGEHDIASEIDRYIAWPGQALAYKIGQLKIRELRREAKAALGARFDVRGFHDAVLENGAVPLDVLEETVNAWVTRQLAAAGEPTG